ncbi:MAG: undecaprenyldiphospho-muramoylpentapeptide beta-N-acetylglucosaminyltransferase [Candidatus Gastranaerophilaceae bacterium]|jgi:UDP-N-acetylglucosamine--N-acetylmuramyl-(pentapeptide) pyrophosphoryl-undecaprenol N-acetylglucosamine transferase
MKDSKGLTVVLAGGGTGGHIYPAIAIAQKLKQDKEIEQIYYVGNPKNLEFNIVKSESLSFLPITVSGMPRKPDLKLFMWYLFLNIAIIKCIYYFIKVKPDVIIGTGGYVSGAPLIAGWLTGIPIVIHDPDAHPGVVSRFMAAKANYVSVAFEQAKKYLNSNKIIVNGNPIRENFSKADKNVALKYFNFDENKKTILVMGGSQGAKTINDALLNCVKNLITEQNLQIIHQTGKKNYDSYVDELLKIWPDFEQNKNYVVRPYFNDMSIPLSCADLAVARAGSLSISELNICGLPSILVPYPFAAANHQKFNALAIEKAGAGIYLDDSDCESDKLFEIITKIIHDVDKLALMKKENLQLAKPDATHNIVDILKMAARSGKGQNAKMFWVIVIAILLMLSVFLIKNIAFDLEIKELSPQEVVSHNTSDKDYIIIDVRESAEYQDGHIKNSTNIPLSLLLNEYQAIQRKKPIVLVCRSGNRSLKALSFLKDQGFNNIINLKGGINAWQKAGYKLEK